MRLPKQLFAEPSACPAPAAATAQGPVASTQQPNWFGNHHTIEPPVEIS